MKSDRAMTAVITGLVLFAVGILVQRILPILGRVAFQAAAAGTYDPGAYAVNLTAYYIIASMLVAVGAMAMVRNILTTRRS